MEIAAFEGKRDDNHVMTTTEGGANVDLKSGDWIEYSPACLGYRRHRSRILPRASGRGYMCSHANDTLCGTVAMIFARHTTGELAVAEKLSMVPWRCSGSRHILVVPCTLFHAAWDMALT